MENSVFKKSFISACRLFALSSLLILPGCGSASKLLSSNDNTVLPGERESVIDTGEEVKADASSKPIIIPTAVTNSDWSQPGGNAKNSPQHLSMGGGAKVLWSVDAGRGSSSEGRLTSSPIVAGNKIFVMDASATVSAFSLNGGKSIWRKNLTPKGEGREEGYGGGIASNGGRIFATTPFGEVIALSASDGRVIWRNKVRTPIKTAPTVAGGKVFLSTVNNEVYALSTSDGSVVWQFEGVGEAASMLSNTSPAVSGGVVVVPYTSGELLAFSTADGSLLWGDNLTKTGRISSIVTINNIAGRPVISGNKVFAVGSSGRMAAIDLKTGQRVWAVDISGKQTPWVAGNYVFTIGGRNKIFAISVNDGKIKWSKRLGSGIWSGPVLAGGRLVSASSKGNVVYISPKTGEVQKRIDLGEGIFIAPIIAKGVAYFLDNGARVIAVN